MDSETHYKIVDLRDRISDILRRSDSASSLNVSLQYIWRRRNPQHNPYCGTGKIYLGPEPPPRTTKHFFSLPWGWRNLNWLFASFELPVGRFDQNFFCDVCVFGAEVQEGGSAWLNSKTDEWEEPHYSDDTLPAEFSEIFSAVANIPPTPLGSFGGNLTERLLSLLIEQVEDRGKLEPLLYENMEEGRPETISYIGCIGVYQELSLLLNEMLDGRELLLPVVANHVGVSASAVIFAKPPDGEPVPLPKVYLSSWRDILDALSTETDKVAKTAVRAAHEKFSGPIVMPRQGGQPRVVKADLLVWWNSLEDRYREELEERDSQLADHSATVQNQFDRGRGGHEETVVPAIAGRVKRRRGST